MWGSIAPCLRRHKKKLLFLSGVVGGIAILNTYLKRRLVKWEAEYTEELYDQLKRSNHFEGTMKTCDDAFLECVPKIRQVVCKTVDVNQIVEEIGENPPNKVQLWEQLKELVFSQALGEMYGQCLLCIFLKVQMSILSGYVFSSLYTNNNEIEKHQTYMRRIEDFMENGTKKLLQHVRRAVSSNLKTVSLHQSVKLQDVEQIIDSIQITILNNDSNFLNDVTCYLTPASTSTTTDDFLARISLETKDVIQCDDFRQVLQSCIDCGISSLMDRMSECYVILSDGKDTFVNPHDFSTPLAKLIPIMHNVFCQHQPTEQGALVHTLLQFPPVNNFAANIYESFSQKSS